MSTQLLVNVIAIGPLGVGDSVTVLHGLRSNDRDVAPTLIQPDRATPIVVDPLSVTDTEVTFTNNGSAPAEAVFRFERGLSNEVDAETVGDLYWQGVVAGGGGGGVNAVTATAPITATGFPITDIALDTTSNFSVTGGGDLDLSNTTVTAAAYGNLAAANQSIVPTFTVDAKGRLTAAASGAIQIGGVAAKTYVDNTISSSTTIAQVYYVTANGNDTTGNGSIAKPFASIQKAHDTAVTAYPSGEFVQIIVGPGTYAGSVTITRLNTFVTGSGSRPENQGTKITTAVVVEPAPGGSTFNNQISISGCFIQTTFNGPAVTVSGNGNYTLTLTNCYLTTTSTGGVAQAFQCLNADVKVVIQNCTLTTQGATPTPVIYLAAGDIKVQACQVQNAAGSTGRMATIEDTAYAFFDSVLFENNTTTSAISVTGTQPVTAPYKLLVSNSSIFAPLSSGVVVNAVGTTSIVTGAVFTVNSAQNIITATAGTVVYGSLTSTPTYSHAISGALAFPYDETHGTLYLPSLGAGALTKNTATGAVTAVAPSAAGNVLTSNGSAWISSPAAGAGLVPVPAGSPALTNGAAVAINSSGALALASATNLTAAPAVGLYVTGGYIRTTGEFTGLTGLVAGSSYYLSTVAGELTTTPPSTSGNVVQYIGRATSATSLFVSPATIVIA